VHLLVLFTMNVLYLCYLKPHREDAAGGIKGTVHADITDAGINVASCVSQ
jgi:hypothetical protein